MDSRRVDDQFEGALLPRAAAHCEVASMAILRSTRFLIQSGERDETVQLLIADRDLVNRAHKLANDAKALQADIAWAIAETTP